MNQKLRPFLTLSQVGKRFDFRAFRFLRRGDRSDAAISDPTDALEDDEDEAFDEPRARDPAQHPRWALRGISFSATQGERIAIIGANGSGKSTLLKIIGGLYLPTEGTISGRGSVVSLNSVLQPFQPTASGLSNIKILCQILRIDAELLRERLEDIIVFSELGARIHDRASSYSKGMYQRLATAAALHLEPDILLIDDGFGVGDREFRDKADLKLRAIVERGAILLYAGHKLPGMQLHCSRAIWLEDGRLRADGPTDDVVGAYVRLPAAQAALGQASGSDALLGGATGNGTDFEEWASPAFQREGPVEVHRGEGEIGSLLSFTLHGHVGPQPAVFEWPAQVTCVAIVEVREPNVLFDAQLELWAGTVLAALARPQTAFRAVAPGRHRIMVPLHTEQLPDQLYSAQFKISFLDANGQGKELAMGTRELLVRGRATRDLRRRRFELQWPPQRMSEPFLTLKLDWQDQALTDDEPATPAASLP